MVLLQIGLCTFHMKMMKYYAQSFDLYYKLFNWGVYIFADILWHQGERDMDSYKWCEYTLRSSIITMIIFYVVCIDAYHISHKYKVRALLVLVGTILYFQFCIFNQIYTLNPNESWDDHELFVPVFNIALSLQTLLLNSLVNFIIFVGKQLILTMLHPNKAMIQIYPRIEWIDAETSSDGLDIE